MEKSLNNPIHFALAGCGRIGLRHAAQMQRYGMLKAVCDVDFSKAVELAAIHGATAYDSLDALLAVEKDINLVAVCTPNGLHARHAIQALRAGVHVLCEKPMALSTHDCGEMIQQAERANRRLFIVKQNRLNPPVAAVKKLIEDGKLGRIYTVQLNCFWNRDQEYYSSSDWKGTVALDGGTLYTQFSHFIDLLYWLVGDIREVHALAGNFEHQHTVEFEDSGVVILKFHNGALGTIHFTINAFQENMEGSLTLFGEKGTVKIGGQYLNTVDYQKIEGYTIPDMAAGNPANDYGKYRGSMSNHNLVYDNIVDVLRHNGSILTNCYEGLKTVEIIEKIYKSAVLVQPVQR
jgi:predicted dehydrogenase